MKAKYKRNTLKLLNKLLRPQFNYFFLDFSYGMSKMTS